MRRMIVLVGLLVLAVGLIVACTEEPATGPDEALFKKVSYECQPTLDEQLEDILDGLFHIAGADEVMHPKEDEYLAQVASRFGFTDTEFSYIKARHVASDKRNPYDVLGVTPEVGDDDRYFDVEGLRTRSELVVPIRAGGVVRGVVDIQSDEPSAFDAADREAIGTLADQIAEGKRLDVRATPTLFVNGKKLPRINDLVPVVDKEAQKNGFPPLGR